MEAGELTVSFRALKTCHFIGLIFEGFPFWEFGLEDRSQDLFSHAKAPQNRVLKPFLFPREISRRARDISKKILLYLQNRLNVATLLYLSLQFSPRF